MRGPTLALLGEAGPEAVIPLTPPSARRRFNFSDMAGIPRFQDGGIVTGPPGRLELDDPAGPHREPAAAASFRFGPMPPMPMPPRRYLSAGAVVPEYEDPEIEGGYAPERISYGSPAAPSPVAFSQAYRPREETSLQPLGRRDRLSWLPAFAPQHMPPRPQIPQDPLLTRFVSSLSPLKGLEEGPTLLVSLERLGSTGRRLALEDVQRGLPGKTFLESIWPALMRQSGRETLGDFTRGLVYPQEAGNFFRNLPASIPRLQEGGIITGPGGFYSDPYIDPEGGHQIRNLSPIPSGLGTDDDEIEGGYAPTVSRPDLELPLFAEGGGEGPPPPTPPGRPRKSLFSDVLSEIMAAQRQRRRAPMMRQEAIARRRPLPFIGAR